MILQRHDGHFGPNAGRNRGGAGLVGSPCTPKRSVFFSPTGPSNLGIGEITTEPVDPIRPSTTAPTVGTHGAIEAMDRMVSAAVPLATRELFRRFLHRLLGSLSLKIHVSRWSILLFYSLGLSSLFLVLSFNGHLRQDQCRDQLPSRPR